MSLSRDSVELHTATVIKKILEIASLARSLSGGKETMGKCLRQSELAFNSHVCCLYLITRGIHKLGALHKREKAVSRGDLHHGHVWPITLFSVFPSIGPDQWICHPLMLWHQSIALISEQQAGLTHSRARLQTPRPPLWFHMRGGVHMCLYISVSVCAWQKERKTERLCNRKYWLCYLFLLTSGAKAGKSIQKGSRMLRLAGVD